MKPVTILLAAYNGRAYVRETIESILAQDSDEWRLVLSDDGNGTTDILKEYADAYPERIELHRSGLRFGSAQKHFMYLLAQYAESPYIMFCDQDDVWHPDKVRLTLAVMREREQKSLEENDGLCPVMVHTDLKVVDEKLQTLDESFMHYQRLDGTRLWLPQLLVQNVVTGCTMMINRPLTRMALKGAKAPEMIMHDWWIALVAAAFGEAVFVPQATIDYRQHENNVVGARNASSWAYIRQRLEHKDLKRALWMTSRQAKGFCRVYMEWLNEDQKDLLDHYAMAPYMHRAARLAMYQRYGLWKKDFKRRIGQCIWW